MQGLLFVGSQHLDGKSLDGLKVERRHGQAAPFAAHKHRDLARAQNDP